MEPKLILINGNPGMGKTTLAQRYVDEHPMALNLDIDNIWIMMGQWQASRPVSDMQKLKYAYAIADMHLAEGYDVIIPNIMQTIDQYEAFERIAEANSAVLKEVVLLSNQDDAIDRCKKRGRALGHVTGFRPGGVLDTGGRERMLATMHENMLATVALRPNVIQIISVEDEVEHTYQLLLGVIS